MKFGLLTVSYSGLFYKGQALSLEEQIFKAKALGFDGLSIEAKRPVASPLDLTKKDRARIKDLAADQGIDLCAIETMSNFSGKFMEDRENNLAMMRLMLQLAADLNVKLVKIFAAWPGVINDEEEIAVYNPFERGKYYRRLYPENLRRWNRAVEGIKEIADRAADLCITLALQNHAPVITPGYEDVLAMKQEIDRKNVKFCLDVPLFYERQNDAYIYKAIQNCGKDIVMTHYGAWNFEQTPDGKVVQGPTSSFGGLINYQAYISELHRIGYNGYLISEYCLPIIKSHKIAGIEAVDHANAIALKYMKELVHSVIPVMSN